jgi:hypothetical protein
MKTLLIAVVALAGALSSGPALAWHAKGHMMVAAVAWPELSDGAKCKAGKLLQVDPTFASTTKSVEDADGVDPREALFIHTAS